MSRERVSFLGGKTTYIQIKISKKKKFETDPLYLNKIEQAK